MNRDTEKGPREIPSSPDGEARSLAGTAMNRGTVPRLLSDDVVSLGKACAVTLTGDADATATVTNCIEAFTAIEECLRQGENAIHELQRAALSTPAPQPETELMSMLNALLDGWRNETAEVTRLAMRAYLEHETAGAAPRPETEAIRRAVSEMLSIYTHFTDDDSRQVAIDTWTRQFEAAGAAPRRADAPPRDDYDDCTQLRAALSDAIAWADQIATPITQLTRIEKWRAALRDTDPGGARGSRDGWQPKDER
jgi:hypothetical protein